jgi:hypothetical protein
MLQLTSAGLPVAQILADAFGVSTEEIIKMREDGLLPAKEVIEALTVYMETNFKGAADNFSTSWAGLMGTFEDLKQMGLREFFGGLFEAIQPVANAFAEWLQGPGLEKLSEWGEAIGSFVSTGVNAFMTLKDILSGTGERFIELGLSVFELGERFPIFEEIGQIIVRMGRDMEEGASGWDAFREAITRLFTDVNIGELVTDLGVLVFELGENTPALYELGKAIVDLGRAISDGSFANFFEDGFLQTIINVFDNIDSVLADILNSTDWSFAGYALGEALAKIFGVSIGTLETKESEFIPALTEAIKGFFEGLEDSDLDAAFAGWSVKMGRAIDREFAEWSVEAGRSLDRWFAELSVSAGRSIDRWFANLSIDIAQGFVNGLNGVEMNINQWVYDKIILPIKTFLGIASPSTVFMQIGKDIVLGLMSGILSMFPGLTSVMSMLFNLLTGGNSGGRTGGATGDATGLLGGGTGFTGTTSGVLAGGTVTNIYNFYGTTYVSGAGPAGTYDCAPTISSGGMIPAGVR